MKPYPITAYSKEYQHTVLQAVKRAIVLAKTIDLNVDLNVETTATLDNAVMQTLTLTVKGYFSLPDDEDIRPKLEVEIDFPTS